jgi:hypothetical protein
MKWQQNALSSGSPNIVSQLILSIWDHWPACGWHAQLKSTWSLQPFCTCMCSDCWWCEVLSVPEWAEWGGAAYLWHLWDRPSHLLPGPSFANHPSWKLELSKVCGWGEWVWSWVMQYKAKWSSFRQSLLSAAVAVWSRHIFKSWIVIREGGGIC